MGGTRQRERRTEIRPVAQPERRDPGRMGYSAQHVGGTFTTSAPRHRDRVVRARRAVADEIVVDAVARRDRQPPPSERGTADSIFRRDGRVAMRSSCGCPTKDLSPAHILFVGEPASTLPGYALRLDAVTRNAARRPAPLEPARSRACLEPSPQAGGALARAHPGRHARAAGDHVGRAELLQDAARLVGRQRKDAVRRDDAVSQPMVGRRDHGMRGEREHERAVVDVGRDHAARQAGKLRVARGLEAAGLHAAVAVL